MSKEHDNVPAMDSHLEQSKERCFPYEFALPKDDTSTCATFQNFFTFIGDITSEINADKDGIVRNKIFPDLKPFNLYTTYDKVGDRNHMKSIDARLLLFF